MIIDYPSAMALQKRGVDVGIKNAKGTIVPFTERFLCNDDQVLLDGCIRYGRYENKDVFFSTELDEGALVESAFPMTDGEIPASYRYQNKDGQKFLVFLFDASALKPNSGLACSYYRQRQITDAVSWMGDRMQVKVFKHPGVYVIAKEDDRKLACAISNFSLDPAYDVLIETDWEGEIEFVGLEGERTDKGILIDSIQPWATGCIIVHK